MKHSNAQRLLAGEIKDFMAEMEQKCGTQLFVMAGYLKPNGSIGVTK
jgi:hypothetical protein